ncbi:hypothetical protein RhiJN_19698 [Ceratobasidium sp. AG-Ba]|nr:hypothetical protein RhiJN_04868 [Ceratobasidium sp. AG-Ba]QRV91680.1 hypothetical protein RhiJN_19698 [Ceratobasidium sp. AG-Ba]
MAMSYAESSVTTSDKTTSVYAPLLHELGRLFDELSVHHNRIVASQVIRSQQTILNVSLWNERFEKILAIYYPGDHASNPSNHTYVDCTEDFSALTSADTELSSLNHQMHKAQEDLLKYEMDLAEQSLVASQRLIDNVSEMIEVVCAEKSRAQGRERELAELVWKLEAEQKDQFVRSWVYKNAVASPSGEGSGDERN